MPESGKSAERTLRIGDELAGQRLDQVLARLLPEYSRSRLQRWIDDGYVTLDGELCKRRDKVRGGEEVRLHAELNEHVSHLPEAIPLRVVFEDEHLLVVDKPADLVVHPAAGNANGTLLNALLHHAPALVRLPRAGIVHRLDKDTTGLLVVAKTLLAHKSLVEQLHERSVTREYWALVNGILVAGGTVDGPIGRHPTHRTRMAVVPGGKPAVTHYRVLARYAAHTLLEVRLETGRTHQIRVHMASIHHPLVGDRNYGGRPQPPRGADPRVVATLARFPRQALHARTLGLVHPATGESLQWQAPLPKDMEELLSLLGEGGNGGLD